jgi:hypothetical protein
VADANTIWTFHEALTRAKLRGKPAIEVLFKRFDAALSAAGFLAMGGQINGRKSAVRAAVEHVFARQKGPMGLFIRTIGFARARLKIGLANLGYMKRLVWLTAQTAPA